MVELIRAALEVLQSGFSYESVFRFLKTGLVMPLAGLSPEVIYQAENYVIALGIRGFKRWNSTWERVYRGRKLIILNEIKSVPLRRCHTISRLRCFQPQSNGARADGGAGPFSRST